MARPRNKVTDELSKKLECSKRHAARLQKEGVTPEDADESKAAKLRKLLVEIEILEGKRDRSDRTVILRSEAFQHGIKIADELNRLSSEAITNWPTELAGKNEIQVREIAQRAFGEFNERIIEVVEGL